MKKREQLYKLLEELKDEIESFNVVFKDDAIFYRTKYREPITSVHTPSITETMYRLNFKLGEAVSFDSNAYPYYKKEK